MAQNNIIDQAVQTHMRILADDTIRFLHERNSDRGRHYIKKAELVYDNSNDHVRHIIVHDFIWPVSAFIRDYHPEMQVLLNNFRINTGYTS